MTKGKTIELDLKSLYKNFLKEAEGIMDSNHFLPVCAKLSNDDLILWVGKPMPHGYSLFMHSLFMLDSPYPMKRVGKIDCWNASVEKETDYNLLDIIVDNINFEDSKNYNSIKDNIIEFCKENNYNVEIY